MTPTPSSPHGGTEPHASSHNHDCAHDHATADSDHNGPNRVLLTRRTALLGGASLAVGMAGCLGGDEGTGNGDGGEPPEPVTLGESDECDMCGMVIPMHPGPSTEIFYADEQPSDHENPARFDSTWEAFQYDFERENRGWDREVFYVTDYSGVDYDIFEDGGDTLISTHPEADAFVEATEVEFVVASDVYGAMGADLIGFSDGNDASAFQDEYGGDRMGFDEVTPEVISGLGRS